MNNEKILLEEWFKRQAEWQQKVTDAEKALVAAQGDLKGANEDIRKIVLEQLDKGQSTGNQLQDEAFRIFGLNKEFLDRCVALNNRLIQNRGKEMLAVFSYRQQVRFSGPGREREDDFQDCRGFVFGILSGERLELMTPNNGSLNDLKVVLPFERHVTWGFRSSHNADAVQPKIGTATLCGFSILDLGKPNVLSFINSVIGKKDTDVSIFIGEEIHNQSSKLFMINLEAVRKALNSATPEEQVMMVDI